MKTAIEEFSIPEGASHAELASVNFDQWILTVGVRIYAPDESVIGMTHVIFEAIAGFRVLDESAMLMFPWDALQASRSFVHEVPDGGWYAMEVKAGNMHLPETAKEYIVATGNECVSVIAYRAPRCVHG